MFLLTDNTLQVINFANKIDFDINKEIAEAAKGIKAIFHSACCADIPQEAMLEELTRIKMTQIEDEEVEELLEKLKLLHALQNQINNAKTILRDTFTDEVKPSLEKVETSIQKIEAQFICLLPIIAIQAKVEDEIKWLDNLNISLTKLLHVIEAGFPVEKISWFKVIQEILEILASETTNNLKPGNDFQEKIAQDYGAKIRIIVKAILWEINNNSKKSNVKFKTVDELFEDWEKKYSEDEVTRSLEIFEKGIDAERRKRGGRTIFS